MGVGLKTKNRRGGGVKGKKAHRERRRVKDKERHREMGGGGS